VVAATKFPTLGWGKSFTILGKKVLQFTLEQGKIRIIKLDGMFKRLYADHYSSHLKAGQYD